MIKFYIKLLGFNTVVYVGLYFLLNDGVSSDMIPNAWLYMCLMFWFFGLIFISVGIIKELKKK